MAVYVGTSGWQYRDWRGLLYPPGLGQGRWLEQYARHFGTVEINGSFYRLPARETFAGWRDHTPDGFVMAVKASRYLTHVRRLRDPAEPVERLVRAAAALGGRLGPVLLQLPPNLPADPGALDDCLAAFAGFRLAPGGELVRARQPGAQAGRQIRVAVECRHESWWTGETERVLARRGAALCWADRLGRPVTPLWRTAGWGYLRFHEGAAQPWPRYGEQALGSWVERITAHWPDQADVLVYFNNDPGGAALYDAAAFAALSRRAGRTVTGTWRPADPAGPASANPA
jgi:uncharacterized protein YecE (DUF72 family)